MICQYDPPLIDNTTGPKASLYIHWFIIILPTSRKIYDKLDGIYHRSIDMFLVCLYVLYVPLGISHGRCPPLIVPYPPSKHVAKGSPWAPWAPKKPAGKPATKNVENDTENRWETREPKQDRPENFENLDLGDFDGFCDCEKSEHFTSKIEIGTTWTWPTHAI